MKKVLVVAFVLAMAGIALADMNPLMIPTSAVVAEPGRDAFNNIVFQRDGSFCGDWAFSLYADLAVSGAGLDATRTYHSNSDTGTMFMDSTGSEGAAPTPMKDADYVANGIAATRWSRYYKSFVDAQFNAAYSLGDIWVWNFNGGGDLSRGFKDVDIWVSTDFGSTYNVLWQGQFAMSTGGANYTGFGIDLPDTLGVTDVVIGAKTNWGDGSWTGLSEIQFNQVPEPATLALLGLGALVLRRKK